MGTSVRNTHGEDTPKDTVKDTVKDTPKINKSQERIIEEMGENKYIISKELSDKKGYWKVE